MLAYTDASVGDVLSYHSYVLLKNNEVILQNCIIKNDTDSVYAELRSVVYLLLECEKLNLKNIIIHTDCPNVVTLSEIHLKYGELKKTINSLLVKTNSKLKWISRKFNKKAHKICDSVIKTVLDIGNVPVNISNLLLLKEERKFQAIHKVGSISKNNLTSYEIDKIHEYYKSIVKKSKRKDIDFILEWGSNKSTNNSKKGLLFFVERFVVRNHTIDEIHFDRCVYAFSPVLINQLN
jgi:hypothetical protein